MEYIEKSKRDGRTNCPNCGAPIERYKCKCDYCGTWYFDFAGFDMSEDVPYYVRFRSPYGIITMLAKPELQTIEMQEDYFNECDVIGCRIDRFTGSRSYDLNVVFHSQVNPEDGTLFKLETKNGE